MAEIKWEKQGTSDLLYVDGTCFDWLRLDAENLCFRNKDGNNLGMDPERAKSQVEARYGISRPAPAATESVSMKLFLWNTPPPVSNTHKYGTPLFEIVFGADGTIKQTITWRPIA